jgi:hypothetical protein
MSRLAIDENAKPIQVLSPTVTYSPVISGSASTPAVIVNGRVARLVTTVPAHYKVNATATTSDAYLPSDCLEYIHVYAGDTISFITSGPSGIAYVTEMV